MTHQERPLLGVSGAVVVGDDGSAEAATAVRWAAEEAKARGVGLVVVRAWSIRSTPRPAHLPPGYVAGEDEYAASVADQLRTDLGRVLGEPLDDRVRVMAVHGSPEDVLVTASREAVLVVVASHGRHLASALLGSTSEHVLRHAHGPVVVVPVRGR